jgi:hypothetical protein
VQGTVNPNARPATYHFDYGTSTDYGSSTAEASLPAGAEPVAVSATLEGLALATTYHVRLVAANADGTTVGADHAFTTTSASGGGSGDTTAPVLLSASLSPKTFAVNRKGAAETPVAAKAKRGTTFRYRLSEAARVVFTIQHATRGRKVGRTCRKPTRANRRKRACTRYVAAGRFAIQAPAGANSKRFSGRIGRRALPPGRYRAVLVATDGAGNRSSPKRLAFRVVKRPAR